VPTGLRWPPRPGHAKTRPRLTTATARPRAAEPTNSGRACSQRETVDCPSAPLTVPLTLDRRGNPLLRLYLRRRSAVRLVAWHPRQSSISAACTRRYLVLTVLC
jgi:hypothetical protein